VEGKAGVVAPPLGAELRMIEAEVVESMRLLEQRGWGTKKIAKELGLPRNTVRRTCVMARP
jgi:predicted DNA-binding protein (UPF0251 family)